MGCGQSKIENEEAVARCKERKQHMKEAVAARNAFAAAHSSYAMYLKNTGLALSDYAQGEVQNPQSIQVQSNSSSVAVSGATPFAESLPPPPPPPSNLPTSPLQRAATMPPEIQISPPEFKPKLKPKTIVEEEDEDENEENEGSLRRKRSSRSNRGGSSRGVEEVVVPPPSHSHVNGTTSTTSYQQQETFEYFFNVDTMPGTLSEMEEVNITKEDIERNGYGNRPKIVEEEEVGSNSKVETEPMPEVVAVDEAPPPPPLDTPPPPPDAADAVVASANSMKKGKQAGSSSGDAKRTVKGNVNLTKIFSDLDDHFLKASESAHEVSKMLEATRLHYHSNFADNRGHIDHSARVMRVITWNRSFRGQFNVDDGNDDFDKEENETHASVLDKLLAWEKKLYDEVKAGEVMKFEYQRKVNSLNKLKKRASNPDAVEKAKAAVSHLHTRYIVDIQSMDSTVSEINRLRDEQLYPKLVQLVDGMATMWDTMRYHHDYQLRIVQDLKYLDISQSPKETTEHHHSRTAQLHGVVHDWHLQFEKLVNKQKDYIKALNTWLKLNLIPTESSLKEKVSSPPRPQTPPIQKLLITWQDYLEKVPDELAKSAIFNFAAVIDTIMHHQEDEIKLREKCEETSKELSRKQRSLEDWYHKHKERTIPDEGEPDTTEDTILAEKQFLVESVKKRLEEEQEAYQRHCLQVREKSIVSLKRSLPELFRALFNFSLACSEMYRDLSSISHPRH
ncbi:protein ROLLING AND ERECT LEAF 2 [Humulus lupulus]|uniref:protein ROLLING AND ERECT LEAF 2 n=1 Tax=Humulus lupulus TaxID=3486 RepID=UPI002B415319|nr:protein ROLLING AND ERECT LEAF 2 [Humulus lupulus]